MDSVGFDDSSRQVGGQGFGHSQDEIRPGRGRATGGILGPENLPVEDIGYLEDEDGMLLVTKEDVKIDLMVNRNA